MIAYVGLIFYLTSLTMCYQRPSQNHNNFDEKATHPPHNFFGYKWTEPYFDLTMPRNVTSLVGKSAYLGCRVKNLGNKTVAWIRHRDLHILTVGTYTYTTDQRFQTTFHRDIDEWTMQIKWAQKRDAGTYECQISTQPVKSFSVDLEIVESIDEQKNNILQQFYNDDAFYFNSDRIYQARDDLSGIYGPINRVAVPTATILGGPDLYVDKGSTINLTCAIKFSPEPPAYIFWYHEDKVMSDDSPRISFHTERGEVTKSILLIEDADIADSGKYSCFPSNTDIASIRVHVLNGERPEAMQTSGGSNLASTAAVYKILAFLYIIYSQLGLKYILNNFTLRPTKSHEDDYNDMNEQFLDYGQIETYNANSCSSIKNIQNEELCKLQRYQNSLRSGYCLR